MTRIVLTFGVLGLALTGICCADTVFLKDGGEVEGTITQENDTQVTIKLANGTTRTYRRTDVDSIVKSAGAPAVPAAKPESAPSAADSDQKIVADMRKAAEGGDAKSQFALGALYSKGLGGLKQDEAEAAKWFKAAMDQGAEFKYVVGILYYTGDGVKQDVKKGLTYIEAGAQGGDAAAQRFIGLAYLQGDGVEKDIAKAVDWLKKSADKGDANGQYLLALLYVKGTGVEKNIDEAEKWMKKSAAQGFQMAVEDLKRVEALKAPAGSH